MFNWLQTPKFVINLARRPDRLAKSYEQFNDHNVSVIRWNAIDSLDVVVPELSPKRIEPNALGILACAMSHIDVIKWAKQNKYDYVVIFEDDIIFRQDFSDLIHIVWEKTDWDMFYMGGHFDDPKESLITTDVEKLYRIRCVSGTYAYVIRRTIYDYILRNWNYMWGIDQFFATNIQDRFVVYARFPMLVGTCPGYSDVAFHYTDYGINNIYG